MTFHDAAAWRCVLTALLISWGASADTLTDAPRKYFDIKAQSLSMALRAYEGQTGEQVVFFSDVVAGRESAAVAGQYTPDEALRKILESAGLTYQRLNAKTVAVNGARPGRVAESAMRNDARRAAPGRLARTRSKSKPKPKNDADAEYLEEMVVTGTAVSEPISQLDAGFAVTVVDAQRIKDLALIKTSDFMTMSPGVWVESSGGESGTNVFFRGFPTNSDAPFSSVQFNGSVLFPPSTLAFLENSALFRNDETTQRVEVLRGGPNPVLANGQAGVTFNFIDKKGGDTPEGTIKISTSDYGLKRTDLYYGGPLAESWFVSLGGFYRESDGIRDTQYPADLGGQFSLHLTRVFDGGEVNFYTRRTADKNVWILPIPMHQNGSRFTGIAGFDAGRGTYHGNETRFGILEVEPGVGNAAPRTVTRDLADGRGADLTLFGTTIDWDLGDVWSFGLKANHLQGDADTMGLVPTNNPDGSVIATAADYLANRVANNAGSTTGMFTYASDGTAVPATRNLMTVGWWSVEKAIKSTTLDSRLNADLGSQRLTFGVYLADFSTDDLWYILNDQLVTAESHSRVVDLALDNGVRVTRNGFAGAPMFAHNASYHGCTAAAYVMDDWQITPAARMDLGARYENLRMKGTLENGTFGADLDNDSSTLYNNNATYLNGTFAHLNFNDNEVAWTAGLNYSLNDHMSTFVRLNSGFRFLDFDGLRNNGEETQRVDQYELGFKALTERAGVFATLFYNEFTGVPFRLLAGDQTLAQIGSTAAYGLELEGEIYPTDALTIYMGATYLHTQFTKFSVIAGTGTADALTNVDLSGNRPSRQPAVHVQFVPSYVFGFPWGGFKLHAKIAYVGKRFMDAQNAQALPAYTTVDAGISIDIGDDINFDLSGTNLMDTLGITESNSRLPAGANAVNDVVHARPIQGRAVMASATYKF